MNLGLASQVAFVAGGSQGLGFGIAQELFRDGAKVFLGARKIEGLEKAKNDLSSVSPGREAEVAFASLETSDPASVSAWISQGVSQFEGLDFLVVNTGGPKPGDFQSLSLEDWRAAGEQLLFGSVSLIQEALPHLKKSSSASILFITSTSVRQPIDNLLLSNVYRPAIAAMAKSLSVELGPFGIRVNTLMPGRIDTERVQSLDRGRSEQQHLSVEEIRKNAERQIPLGRYGEAEEFGRVGAFLLSPAASYLNGVTFPVDGGMLKTI